LGKHRVADCKSKLSCKHCSGRHHTSLYSQKSVSGNDQEKKTVSTNEKKKAVKNDASILHSANKHIVEPVLLKTAIASVQSNFTICDANILFDEGAQRSFITENLAQKLNIVPTGTESHYLSGFRDKIKKVRHLQTATISL
jgi:hypothetical protein